MSTMFEKALRISGVGEYYFSGKLAQIRRMKEDGLDVINLGIGSPDLPPHPGVLKTLPETASEPGAHGYQPYRGVPELREAVAGWYAERFGIFLDPERNILPVMGSKEAILQISLAYLDPGDEVLVPDPGYPAYSVLARMAGGIPRTYRLNEHNGWLPRLEELEEEGLEKVKLMWVNYPHMPTGAPAHRDFFGKLRDFGKKNHILICNDNPYSFILNREPLSLFHENGPEPGLVELNSLSKSHNMAGWRIGFIVAHESHIADILLVSSNYQSGMFLPVQRAAATALRLGDAWYEQLYRVYDERRRMAESLMNSLCAEFEPSQQGMFLWGRLPGHDPDDRVFSDRLLEQALVFVTPGSVFGQQGKGYIRISLCSPAEILEKAAKRVVHL
ncbi:MAG: pyridoxal phosphate-dependent aminotransferase [Bacteroidales bacterium]